MNEKGRACQRAATVGAFGKATQPHPRSRHGQSYMEATHVSTRNPSGTGRRLAARRAAAGLTQRQLASRSGLSENVISDLETGRRDISHCRISTVLKITQELDCTIEDLL